jgi:ATP-dependent DNA helicase RecQ
MQLSEAIAALVTDVAGPDVSAPQANLERLPVQLALSVALYLAQRDDVRSRVLATEIYEALRPLAGETVSMDDDLGRLALALGRAAEALQLLEARLERSEALGGYQQLVRAYLALGRGSDARALVARLKAEAGGRITTWLIHGEVELALGDARAAAAAYSHAQALSPQGTGASIGLARAMAALGDEQGARQHMAQVFVAYQNAPPAWVLREALDAATRLGDSNWAAELRAQLEEQDEREAANLSAMVRGALAADGQAGRLPGTLQRDRGRISLAQARQKMALEERTAHDAGDEAVGGEQAADGAEDEPPSAELLEALRDHFGYESFLPGQVAVIQAVLRGEDVLALLPTGAGKSLCYQLSALLLPGTTILISPLIALMKDQVDGLPAAVRSRATVVNSMIERDTLDERLRDIAAGRYKLVYAAPERLRQQSFVYALRRAGVARFVVDEAHCVSLWGHDFRPDYLFIAKALRQLARDGAPPPVLALTATATPEVRTSIGEALQRTLRVVNRGIFRPNLRYEVVRVGNNEDRLRRLAQILQETPGSAIVYVRSREGCEEVAEFLSRRCRVSALYYHAGMERTERESAQDAFISGRARVVVATVAFGMGIDKPDVRLIVHYQLPTSLEAYVQESGRAGRDGKPSRCVLFSSTVDAARVRGNIRRDELSIDTLRAVYATTRTLVRAGAAPGAALVGRVAAADLEREVSAAIESSGRQVDEVASRVALSILERAGFLLRHPDVPRAPSVRMGTDLPGDPAEERAFRAFTAAAHLRPRQFQTLDLLPLSAQLGMSPDALEDRLLGWRDAGLLEYRDGARDLLVEIRPAPPEGKTALPALLDELAARHDRQVDTLVAYARATVCRQRVIARHFGERLPVSQCGICDRCRGEQSSSPSSSSQISGRRLVSTADSSTIRATILACLRELPPPYQVGVTGLVRLLVGSVNTGPAAARSRHFGALAEVGVTRLKREVLAMVEEGLLVRDEAAQYPVLCVRGG